MDADAMMERVAEEHFAAEGRGDDKRPLTAALVALYGAAKERAAPHGMNRWIDGVLDAYEQVHAIIEGSETP
jgi:hypothetical protein